MHLLSVSLDLIFYTSIIFPLPHFLHISPIHYASSHQSSLWHALPQILSLTPTQGRSCEHEVVLFRRDLQCTGWLRCPGRVWWLRPHGPHPWIPGRLPLHGDQICGAENQGGGTSPEKQVRLFFQHWRRRKKCAAFFELTCEYYRHHRGLLPAECDRRFLDLACRVDKYGMDFHKVLVSGWRKWWYALFPPD